MTSLRLIPVLALALVAGGCIFAVNTGDSNPGSMACNNKPTGIPSNAILVMYGQGVQLSNLPKPVLAPGLIYIYDESRSELTLVAPHNVSGEFCLGNYLNPDHGNHRFRVYYTPGPIAPATTRPVMDAKSV